MQQLTGKNRQKLHGIMMQAFPSRMELAKLVSFTFNRNIDEIVSDHLNLSDSVFELIKTIESWNRLEDFICGALEQNKSHQDLRTLAIEWECITTSHVATFTLPPLQLSPPPPQVQAFLTDRSLRLTLKDEKYYREEFFISTADALKQGVRGSEYYAIFIVDSTSLGKPKQQYGVRIVVDRQLPSGTLLVNRPFAEGIGLLYSSPSWSLQLAGQRKNVTKVIFELMVERSKLDAELQFLRDHLRELFVDRSLLVKKNDTIANLSLPILDRGYFNIHALEPDIQAISANTLFVIDENTRFQLFVSHRKSAVDMVVVVDVSGSMDTPDYLGADQKPHTRLDGVRVALDTLFQRRMVTGSRVSHLAITCFAEKTFMLYPRQPIMEELKSEKQIRQLRADFMKQLLPGELKKLGIKRSPTDISQALQTAAYLLDLYAQEGNEKVIILLSDGADWKEDTEQSRYGEIVSTIDDPAALADTLHFCSQICIHTIAISDIEAYKRFIDPYFGTAQSTINNTAPDNLLLQRIAALTEGIYFESPDANVLSQLFDEIGQGTIYPLM